MSQLVTVSTLTERVRTLCDLASYTTNTGVTTAAILDLIKTSFSELAAIVKEYTTEQLLTTSGTLTTTASVSTVSLPTNFSDLVRIAWQKDSTTEIDLEKANSDQFLATPQGGYSSGWDGYGVIRYRLMGPATIELFPTPDAAYTLRLYYTTGIYVTSTSDVVMMRDGWDQWVVFNTCGLVRMRQQKTAEDPGPGSFFAQRDKKEADIRRQLKRDKFGINRIKDVRDPLSDPRLRAREPWRF
jgi:hypothetical protein